MDPMVGMIYIVPFNWAPNGYQICQGQTVTVMQYQALYSLIAMTYGGDGQTNFKLPNLQGRVPIGFGVSPVSGKTYPLASTAGTETETLTVPNLPSHNHPASFSPTTGPQTVTLPATPGTLKVDVTVNATPAGATSASPTGTANMLSTASGGQRIYGSTQTTGLVSLGGVLAPVTGNPAIPASTVTIQAVNGGTVSVGNGGASAALNNMQPSLALNFIIAMNGIYPDRP